MLAEPIRLIKLLYEPKASFAQQVKELLQVGEQALLIDRFPTEAEPFSRFIEQISSRLFYANALRKQDALVALRAEKQGSDYRSYSRSPYHFALHSDGSERENPPEAMALLCIEAAEQGGASLFCHIGDLLALLGDADKEALTKQEFLFRNKAKPILWQEAGHWQLRYNRIHIEQGTELSLEQAALLDRLDAAAAQAAQRLVLQAGQLLLLDNMRFLHGREAFAPSSGRCLLRLRFYLT